MKENNEKNGGSQAAALAEKGKDIGEKTVAGAVGAARDSAYPIMMNSIQALFFEGESLEDTLTDAGTELAKRAAKGGSEVLVREVKESAIAFLKESRNPALQSCKSLVDDIAGETPIGQVAVFLQSCGESLLEFMDGEISGEQFADEIMINGAVTFISAAIGTAFPIPLVGPVLAGAIAKAAEAILDTRAHMDDYLKKEQMIHSLSVQAQAEMESRRLAFHEMVQDEFEKWDSAAEEAFYQILSNSFEENFDLGQMINGLDKILALCGAEAKFHSVEEWESQLDLPLDLSF